ncbi:MAG: polyamine aminopropyltransferase [Candidatus Saccharimonadales bacterium]
MPNTTNLDSSGKWFTEAELPYADPTVRISTKIDGIVYDQKSPFGHIQIFDTQFYGRMLTLDGIIQVAEKDEFIYHEMMIILPAIKHGNPKKVLIIGGGDGGAVKQALRIKSVEKVVMVEIDQSVIDMCGQYIPSIANGSLDDPKVEVIIQDGKEYVENCNEKFDLIAMDLTDPIPDGPSANLYEKEFYEKVKELLSEDGALSTHCSSLVIQPDEAKMILPKLQSVFDEVALHTAVVPTYQLTSFGFVIARNVKTNKDPEFVTKSMGNISDKPKYLSKDMYFASAVIPPYMDL